MSPAAFLAFNSVLIGAAVGDLRCFRIPNLLPAALCLAGLTLAFPLTAGEGLSRAGSVAAVGLIGGALWLKGLMGGGDFKLLVACAVWIPLGGLPLFAMALGLASGLQGAAALARAHCCGRTSLAAALRTRLPYGVSIAAAGLAWSVSRLAP